MNETELPEVMIVTPREKLCLQGKHEQLHPIALHFDGKDYMVGWVCKHCRAVYWPEGK